MPLLPLLAASLLLSSGSASLRWEHRHGAAADAPLESAVELAFDDPAPPYGPEARALDGRDRVLESRVGLAQRFGEWLFAANATLATNLRYQPETDLGYALALSWTARALVLGIELFGGLGDTHLFPEPPCRRHFLAPTLAFTFSPGWTARAEAAGPIAGGGDGLLRIQLAREF